MQNVEQTAPQAHDPCSYPAAMEKNSLHGPAASDNGSQCADLNTTSTVWHFPETKKEGNTADPLWIKHLLVVMTFTWLYWYTEQTHFKAETHQQKPSWAVNCKHKHCRLERDRQRNAKRHNLITLSNLCCSVQILKHQIVKHRAWSSVLQVSFLREDMVDWPFRIPRIKFTSLNGIMVIRCKSI